MFPPAARENAVAMTTAGRGQGGGGRGGAAASAATAAVAESSLGPRCKKRESRRAAFALLSALCRGSEAHLRQTFVLLGGRDLVARDFLDSVGDGDGDAGESGAGAAPAAEGEGGGSGDGVSAGAGAFGEQGGDGAAAVVALDETLGAGAGCGEPWDYDPTSVLKDSGQHVGLQNQVRTRSLSASCLFQVAADTCGTVNPCAYRCDPFRVRMSGTAGV